MLSEDSAALMSTAASVELPMALMTGVAAVEEVAVFLGGLAGVSSEDREDSFDSSGAVTFDSTVLLTLVFLERALLLVGESIFFSDSVVAPSFCRE